MGVVLAVRAGVPRSAPFRLSSDWPSLLFMARKLLVPKGNSEEAGAATGISCRLAPL